MFYQNTSFCQNNTNSPDWTAIYVVIPKEFSWRHGFAWQCQEIPVFDINYT